MKYKFLQQSIKPIAVIKRKRGVIMTGLLAGSYLFADFLLFDLHGMKQWPTTLAAASIVIIPKKRIFHAKERTLHVKEGKI